MNKNYMRYIIESKKIGWIFFAIMYAAISLFPKIVENDSDGSTTYFIAYVLSIILAVVLPIMQYHFVHNKKSVDTYFALPISRKEMLVTNYIFQFCYIFGLFAIISLLSILTTPRINLLFSYVPFVFLHGAVSIAVLLLVVSALYLIANNMLDGIIMIAAYSAMPLLLLLTSNIVGNALTANGLVDDLYAKIGMYSSPFALAFGNFMECVSRMGGTTYYDAYGKVSYGIVLLGYGAIAAFLLYQNFVKRKAERAEQISDNKLAYPFVIHFYLILVLLCLGTLFAQKDFSSYIPFSLILFTIYVIAMFVYQRKIMLNAKILLRYFILTAITIALCVIGWHTKGFGYAYRRTLPKNGSVHYTYYAHVLKDDLESPDFTYMDDREVQFDIEIPVKEMSKYKEVYDLLESIRRQYIDSYYKHEQFGVSFLTTTDELTTTNNSGEHAFVNNRSYSSNYVISLNDLKMIDRYTPVLVYDVGETMSLKDFLKESAK